MTHDPREIGAKAVRRMIDEAREGSAFVGDPNYTPDVIESDYLEVNVILDAFDKAGYVVVPVGVTNEMREAGALSLAKSESYSFLSQAQNCYRAMIRSALKRDPDDTD